VIKLRVAFGGGVELYYILLNLLPLAPMIILAGVTLYWLRASRWAWTAAGLIGLCAPGIVLTWLLRDAGFHAFGGSCAHGKARGFMEAMQLVFLAQMIAGIAGSVIMGAVAVRRNRVIGVVTTLALGSIAIVTGFLIFFAGAMTAVDGYSC
jgi:hypothetical protein